MDAECVARALSPTESEEIFASDSEGESRYPLTPNVLLKTPPRKTEGSRHILSTSVPSYCR